MSAPHVMTQCIRHALDHGYMPDKGEDINDWIDDMVGVVPREHLSWMLEFAALRRRFVRDKTPGGVPLSLSVEMHVYRAMVFFHVERTGISVADAVRILTKETKYSRSTLYAWMRWPK